MTYDFSDYVRHTLFISDNQRAAEVTAALETLYAEMMATNPNNLESTSQNIKVEQALIQLQHDLHSVFNPKTGGRSLLYHINIKRDLDFRGGDPAFSVTPRLLFRVPERKRDESVSLPLRLNPIGDNVQPGVAKAVITDHTVLVYPNQEGPQEKIEDRPVVQECAVAPGDFVILGRVGMDGRKAVWDSVAAVMQVADGENPFTAFDECGTIEDLAEILDSVRAKGFGNQYNTSESYRSGLDDIPQLSDAAINADQISGFYAKPSDKTEATLRYVPGDVFLVGSGQAKEVITGGGFALYEDSKGTERYAPLSRAYAKLSMIFKRSSDAVDPLKQAAPLKFAGDHPLRDFSGVVGKFLNTISQINQKYAPAPQKDRNEGFEPGMLPGLA